MSKKWKEIGNNGTVGAAKHNLANLKDWFALQREKPSKTVKEDKTKEKEVKAKNVSEKRREAKKGRDKV